MKRRLMIVMSFLAIFLAACGAQPAEIPTVSVEDAQNAAATAGIPQTGPGNLEEVLNLLRTSGATVNVADPVQSDVLTVPGQIVHINNEEVEFYTYESAGAAESEAPLVADLNTPDGQPQFYQLGNFLIRYPGSNALIRDLLEGVLGATAAGQ
jgi:hypothetical protein